MENLTIGKLAKETGTNIETIRYYERRGLIPEPPRRESGYRVFSQKYVERILFIKRAQTLGFTLKEVLELLAMADGTTDCKDVKKFAEGKLVDIEMRIGDLKKIKKVLHDLVKRCPDKGKISDCPIIESLTKHKGQK
ncbi:MAG: Hg(II)-responsive transcriptional regulator [Candidatus Anammoxibacter sp.]